MTILPIFISQSIDSILFYFFSFPIHTSMDVIDLKRQNHIAGSNNFTKNSFCIRSICVRLCLKSWKKENKNWRWKILGLTKKKVSTRFGWVTDFFFSNKDEDFYKRRHQPNQTNKHFKCWMEGMVKVEETYEWFCVRNSFEWAIDIKSEPKATVCKNVRAYVKFNLLYLCFDFFHFPLFSLSFSFARSFVCSLGLSFLFSTSYTQWFYCLRAYIQSTCRMFI